MSTTRQSEEPPPLDRLMTLEEVRAVIPLSASHIYRMVKAGTFPAQVHLGPNRVAWRQRDIVEWLNSRPQFGPTA